MSLRQILHYFTGKPVILHLLPFHYFTHSILQYITENFPIHYFTVNHLITLQKFSPPITLFFSTVLYCTADRCYINTTNISREL